jgi:hypothetical protein
MRELIGKIFYWLFLKQTTREMYHYVCDGLGTRYPTGKGKDFYKVYYHLILK